MYDLIIVGGGPGGVAAGVYAARKQLHTLLVTESFGGQSEVSADIQNWIGTKSISGIDFAQNLEAHVRAQESITIVTGEKVYRVSQTNDKIFLVSTDGGVTYRGRTVIVASGARRRKLGVQGEDEYNGRGVAYCSTCDAPFFKGKEVAVVGGGNAGLEAVLDLVPYASKIYLLEFGEKLKGDPITQEKVVHSQNVQVIFYAETTKIYGDKDSKFVGGIEYRDAKKDAIKRLVVGGVFIEIGAVPNSEMVKDLVQLNKFGEIILDHRSSATTREGIWATGDVTDEIFKQNNISAGDGVKAALSAYMYLQKLKINES
ncbi:MAG: FAD-dependent oxidoreductase [Patescibacteria group bacterium]